MEIQNRLIAELAPLSLTVNPVDHRKRGYHCEVFLGPAQLRAFAQVMHRLDFYLVFVSGVHLDPDMEILYQFAHHGGPCRTLARLTAPAGGVPTISDIFHGANWHERETWEMYGVAFTGHPFLKPLLLPEEDAGLNPLRKAEGALKPAGKVRPVVAETAKAENNNGKTIAPQGREDAKETK